MASAANANLNAVRETMDVLLEISRLLNTGLDMESLSICVRLCEQGINPEALSAVIKELRKASESLKVHRQRVNFIILSKTQPCYKHIKLLGGQ
ncbi:Mitotic-spindle organizing protein 1 [Nibea albiflora]|uniref:Mitotic-spindle organizing protein 1 n=1 Tax=Nibea albiflora TaxID=240163 RepID=A0ACB7EDY1_NIBAL|nr:Mitotic-spindle organizing protein 1 [Nibea albiflora]